MTDSKISEGEFEMGIKLLEAAFRIKPLTTETIDIYYSKLKDTDVIKFREAIDYFIERTKYFPSISEFMDIVKPAPLMPRN